MKRKMVLVFLIIAALGVSACGTAAPEVEATEAVVETEATEETEVVEQTKKTEKVSQDTKKQKNGTHISCCSNHLIRR